MADKNVGYFYFLVTGTAFLHSSAGNTVPTLTEKAGWLAFHAAIQNKKLLLLLLLKN
jgi:hypothetical protein